jgi:membrane protease YdiL (CAAX protease family)
MPPDERDATADTNSAPPPDGEWSASERAEIVAEVVAEEVTGTVSEPRAEIVAEVIAEEVAGMVIEPPAAPPGAVVHPEAVTCRRCGETAHPVNKCCPWCGLWVVGAPPRARPVEDEDEEPEDDWHDDEDPRHDGRRREPVPPIHPGVVVGVSYVLLIASLYLVSIMAAVEGVRSTEEAYGLLALVEILDAVLAVTALALVWRTARQTVPEGTRLITWITALPVLCALLAMGIAYTTFLRELARSFGAPEPEQIRLTLATVLLICVQPAIVEELFFRQMVLGVFRKWMNLHAAVWITALMFAVAHINRPIIMPYLLLGGAVFGYARVYGGLALAMLMHFIHNFVVIAYEAWK